MSILGARLLDAALQEAMAQAWRGSAVQLSGRVRHACLPQLGTLLTSLAEARPLAAPRAPPPPSYTRRVLWPLALSGQPRVRNK